MIKVFRTEGMSIPKLGTYFRVGPYTGRLVFRARKHVLMWGARTSIDPVEQKPKFVNLDSDHKGHLFVVLAEYHTYLIEGWHCGEFENDDVADTCYLLGNIEGRLWGDCVTEEDLELLQCWEDEVEEWKENNDGHILRP